MDTLMTIGEFSNRCGLSARVLRNYADIGVLVPAAVDPASGYRYYEDAQLAQAEVVALLRRAGVAVADIGRFLGQPSAEGLDGWEQSLVAEANSRRQALAEVRGRLNLDSGQTRGTTVIEIKTMLDRVELQEVLQPHRWSTRQTDPGRRRPLLRPWFSKQPWSSSALANGPEQPAVVFGAPEHHPTLRVIMVIRSITSPLHHFTTSAEDGWHFQHSSPP